MVVVSALSDWFQGLRPTVRFVVGIGLGAGIGDGHVPWSVLPFSLFCLFLAVAAFLVFKGWKPAALFGWSVGIGYFGVTMFWIVEPFLVEPERHGWMAPFALVFMVGGLALFWALGFGLAAGIGRTRRQRLATLVVALGLAELLRSYAFTGFPWGLLGYIWLDTPFAQLAAYLGPHGLGAFALGVAILPLAFPARGIGIALSLAVLGFGAGIGLMGTPLPKVADPPRIRLVQPNAPQHQKWDPQFSDGFFDRQLDYTAAPASRPPDLIIWPEASVTFWLDDEPETQHRIVAAAPPASKVIIGARRYQGRRFYNSLAVLGDTGLSTDIYDKSHLVPFGEYIPFGAVLSRFGIYGLAAEEGGGFSAGSEPRLIDLGKAGKILPLICYEAIFPQLANISTSPARPDWILQITNDAWYGQFAGPQQHLAQARMRAIEQGLPLVRVANTGISAVIDVNGVVTAQLPLGHAGYLDADVPAARPATIYSRTGDWAILIVLLSTLGLVLIERMRN